MLSFLYHAQALKWSLPTAMMLASAPTTVALWGVMRLVTAALPGWMYTAADDGLYSLYIRLILFFFHNYTGAEIQLYGDIESLLNERKNVIFICNHQCTVDWIVVNMLASQQSCIGRVRFILKDGLKFFPLAGFYLKQRSCIYVKKTGKFNQEKAAKQLARLKQDDVPVWLVIFPEGTRMNPELKDNIERSQQLALEQGLEPFEYVLTPKVKGLQLAVEHLQQHVDAVYDVTVAYNDSVDPETGDRIPASGMIDYLSLTSPQIHIHFDKIPIQDVPKGDEDMKKWLFTRFRFKDKLLSHFYSRHPEKRGRFPGHSEMMKIPVSATMPSFLFYSACLVVLLGTPGGRTIYWKTIAYGTLCGCLWMCIRS